MRALDLSLPTTEEIDSLQCALGVFLNLNPEVRQYETHRRIGKEGTIDTQLRVDMFFLPEPRRHV